MVNENIKVGDTVNERVVTKLELDVARKLSMDVRLVREDTVNGTGVVMLLTDLASIKKFCSSHKSWSPRFFTVGTTCKDDKGNLVNVAISGSGYNKHGEGVKVTTKAGVL